MEYKVINKHLMAERRNSNCSWQIRDNIFETVKHYLVWSETRPSSWLPLIAPHFLQFDQSKVSVENLDAYIFPTLVEWYTALSKPNSPYKRQLKVTPEEYKSWVLSLDLSKPFDRASCDKMFEIVSSVTKREVDEVAIAENENREAE